MAQIQDFTEIPNRTGTGGGGRKASEELTLARALKKNQRLVVDVEVKDGETFQDAVKRHTAKFRRKGALDFDFKIRTDKDARTAGVYRMN